MVEIILTAKTAKGEKAIHAYNDEKISMSDRFRLRARNMTGERKIISDSPIVHVSTITAQGADAATIGKRFKVLEEQMILLYEKKLLDYGATRDDVDVKVRNE